MAAKEIYISVKLDAKDGEKTIGKLNNDIKFTLKNIENLESAQALLNDELKKAELGSENYKELSKQLKVVNQELKNIDLANETLDSEQFATSVKGLAGGLTDVAGGLTLIGVSGEGIEKIAETFAQVEGLSKVIAGGLDIYNEGLKVTNSIITKAVAAHEALAVATTAEGNASLVASGKMKILNFIMNQNPILLLVTGIGLLIGAFALLSMSVDKQKTDLEVLNEVQSEYNDLLVESRKGYADERAELEKNLAIAKDETQSKKDRETAIKNINAISPEYLGNITLETINTKEAKGAIDAYIESLDKKAKAQAYSNLLAKEYEKLVELQTKSGQELVGFWDMAGNSIKAQFEEISSGNLGALISADQKTLQNALERNAKRGEALKNQEIKSQEKRIEIILELIKTETKEGEINTEISNDAKKNADDLQKKYDELAKKRLDNSNQLAAELKRLRDQEELDLAKTEDDKTKILFEREALRLQNIYDNSQKTEEDKKNLYAALIKLDEKYLRDKKNKEDKAQEEAEKQAKQNALNTKNEELAELQAGFDQAEKLRNTERQNEENEVNDRYFRLIELAKKHGEDVTALEEAQQTELKAIKEKYAKEDEQLKEEELQEFYDIWRQKIEITRASVDAFGQIFEASFNSDFDAIASAFSNLETLLLDPENGIIAKFQNGTLGAIEAISMGLQIAVELADQIMTEKLEAEAERRTEIYNADKEALDNSLANRLLSQAEYDAKLKLLDQKKQQEELQAKRKAFNQGKAIAIVNATILTAQAVLSAFSSAAAIPIAGVALGPIMAGVAGALGAAQIAIIASQKFKAARGGIVPGIGSGKFDSVDAVLAPGETVINSNSSRMFPALLSEINRVGGGIDLVPQGIGTMGGTNKTVYESNQQSNQAPVEAYVVEYKRQNVANRLSRIERSAEIGRD